MKKRTNIILKTSIMAIMMLCLVAIAMAADPNPTLITTTLTNAKVNLSIADGNNVTHVTVFASSPSTANSSSSKVFNITNSTATNFMFGYANFTLSAVQVLEDSNDYTVTFMTTATQAGTNGKTGTTATSVTVDRTTPTAPSALLPATSTVTNHDQTFSGTVVGATTTGCTLIFDGTNPPRTTSTMTHSGNTCSLSLTNIPSATYRYAIVASDGTQTATSDYVALTVDGGQMTSGKKAFVIAAKTGQEPTKEGAAKGLSLLNDGSEAKGAIAKEFTTKELAKTGIGAAGGAVIGTAIFPVIGTGLGALVGAGFGLWL